MSEILPNNDLVTEVLKQDSSFEKVQSQKEVDFKQKYKPNSSFSQSVLFQNLKFAIPAGVAAVLLLVVMVFWQSSRVDLLDQKTSSNQVNIQSKTNFSDDNAANLNLKIQNPTNSAAPNPTQEEKSAIDQNLAPLETNVKKADGSEVRFSYNSNLNLISYKGKIAILDGCTTLRSSKLEMINSSFTLKYKLKRLGQVCNQAMGEVPVSGDLQIRLNQEQLQNFEYLFKLENDLQ